MIRVAIVGDIGSGKTYISKLFGYPLFNADFEVSKIYKRDKNCYQKIKTQFPKLNFSFPLQKQQLIKCILSNPNNLKKLSKIVHPIVRKKLNLFLKKNRNKKIIILDIPLYFENKINLKNDIVIFVQAKKEEIKKRLQRRKEYSSKLLKIFKKIQLPLDVKKRRSNFIIKNNFSNNSVKKALKYIINQIKKNDRSRT